MDFFFPDGLGLFQDNVKIHRVPVVKEWSMRTHECQGALWMEINVVTLHKVVETILQQMRSVIKAKGGPTK